MKKILSVLAAITLAFCIVSLTGCGNNKTNETGEAIERTVIQYSPNGDVLNAWHGSDINVHAAYHAGRISIEFDDTCVDIVSGYVITIEETQAQFDARDITNQY